MVGRRTGVIPTVRLLAVLAAVVLSYTVFPTVAAAEPGTRSFSIAGGRAPYDLSGTGTASLVGFAVELPVNRTFIVEPGMRYFRYRTQGNEGVSYFLPEVSLQAQTFVGALRPYLGVGVGAALLTGGYDSSDLTTHAALGVRMPFSERGVARLEMRARSIDPFTGSTADVTLGLGWRF